MAVGSRQLNSGGVWCVYSHMPPEFFALTAYCRLPTAYFYKEVCRD